MRRRRGTSFPPPGPELQRVTGVIKTRRDRMLVFTGEDIYLVRRRRWWHRLPGWRP